MPFAPGTKTARLFIFRKKGQILGLNIYLKKEFFLKSVHFHDMISKNELSLLARLCSIVKNEVP